jgi:pimeloyl-ACP methyl ester carboxylesterase
VRFILRRRVVSIVVTALIGSLAAVVPASALTVPYNGTFGWAQVSATALPPGASPFACTPSFAHPRPVILVHGTFGDMSDSWQALAPLLYNEGYCVYAFNYGSYLGSGSAGIYGVGDIAQSASELATYVSQIRTATGASQVDIVGHSQGGMMPRYYLNFLGGSKYVHTLVALAPSNHGTSPSGIAHLESEFHVPPPPPGTCPACTEQEAGSAFLTAVNSPETVAGVDYTVIESEYDGVVLPYTSSSLTGPNVTNIVLQSQCALDHGDHMSMPYDHIADNDVLNALDPGRNLHARCTLIEPFKGG